MKSIKKSYYYFFYKIYHSIWYTSKAFGGETLVSSKAGLVMLALELWILISLGAYYAVYTKTFTELTITKPIAYIPVIVLFAFNYFTLDYKDKWKQYNNEFDNYSKRKNCIAGWIVFGIIVLIITNFTYSLYLMSEIDWSKYR
ncbi:hypothetical protein [Flavobacterium quisquiliarum]|jgi:heme/copper-type cytochrome/quinol oxidase subunit 2|uniref:Uncharacterized protein n=1 Tax=Flavobacterium quisquiliarum TaxID=1834436 RepID=A0ABV8W3H4_9FLAO|nr:hypothetical protein [Flavobacterium quisquiliarum]MBW1654741.1 hypothetical protein [Flavobacterium quisquiliarum]NWL01572.1 hypothetical protein [Flavobacterium collinsii]